MNVALSIPLKVLTIVLLCINLIGCDVIVQLPTGTIRGAQNKSANGQDYYAFQKIPYAVPPLGKLRFQAPKPTEKWQGILNTTYLDKICYQAGTDQPEESEDCLYLNVYTPELPEVGKNPLRAVLFYIYGGGYAYGHSMTERRGPQYLIEHDIVIVTFNYRLGPFGFLSMEDSLIPGNAGLKDQLLALKWVHENIKLFGGDPSKVTLVGESSGASAIGFFLLNAKTAGLYRGAVFESGSPINPWAINRNARKHAFQAASILKPALGNSNDSRVLLEYLQQIPAQNIDRFMTQSGTWGTAWIWGPVIEQNPGDDAILTEKMYANVKNGKQIKVPILIGTQSEESLGNAADLPVFKQRCQSYERNLSLLVPEDMRVSNLSRKNLIGTSIKQLYVGNENFGENLGSCVRFNSDDRYSRAIIKYAELVSNYSDVFFYQFSYDGALGNVSIPIEGAGSVAHAEELRYLWWTTNDGVNNSDLSKFPPDDVKTQHRMLKMWTNFIKFLNPTPVQDDLLQHQTWSTISSRKPSNFIYLDIDKELQMRNHPKEATYKAWVALYDSLGYEDFDMY